MAGSARNTTHRSSSSPGYLAGDDGATAPVTTTGTGRASSADIVGSNHQHHQQNSMGRQHTPPFPALTASTTAPVGRSSSQHRRRKPSSASSSEDNPGSGSEISVSWLQPRIAVVLGVPTFWHPFLFACRLFSIAPALWWGVRCALRFLITDFLRTDGYGYGLGSYDFLGTGGGSGSGSGGGLYTSGDGGNSNTIVGSSTMNWGVNGAAATTGTDSAGMKCGERRLYLTETALSIIWCSAAAYLSFIFTDSLMSRWLLNYTPQATIVRLATLSCILGFVASQLVPLLGGDRSPALLLPAWIGIATTLTACYHASQRRINIRKETSASVSAFSIASFISMLALLANLHLGAVPARRDTYPDIPLVAILQRAAEIGGRLIVAVLGVNRERDGL